MGNIWCMSTTGREKISSYAKRRYIGHTKQTECLQCSKQYTVALSRLTSGRGKFCSRACKISFYVGKHLSPSTQFKKGENKGDKNTNWKGNSVKYVALHTWVRRNFTKQPGCEMCGSIDDKNYNWANKSNKYTRNRDDWLFLCKKCHNNFDNVANKAWTTKRLKKQS